jgi:hypothetical protein
MTTDIVVVKHTTEAIEKLVASYSKLDSAATAAKWEELDGAVEKSIVDIDQKFEKLGSNLIKVRAFLSQQENPGRKEIVEGIVGFPADLTWTVYAQGVAARLKISARCLQDKIAGYQLGLPDGQLASSAKRREKKQQLKAATAASVVIEDTPSDWSGNVFKPAAAAALVEVAKAANNVVEAVDAGFDPAPAIANLRINAISGRKLNAILLAVDVEAKDTAPAPDDSTDWKAALAKLLDALDTDCMTQHLNKQTKAVISEVEGLVNPVPAAEAAHQDEDEVEAKAPKAKTPGEIIEQAALGWAEEDHAVDAEEYAANEALLTAYPEWICSATIGD